MRIKLQNFKNKTEQHKTLIQNFSYLSGLQIFSLLIPVITLPYLIRVLGKETYGLVVFAQAIIGYFLILVGFGFNISATKEVSFHRDNPEKLTEIVSSVFIIKTALFVFLLVILTALLYFIPQAKGYESLFFLTMWMCLYEVIFPMWYFQGIEKMKYITYITLISRLTFLILIFVFIHSPEDFLLVPIINGIGALLAGTISLFILFGNHQVKFRIQPIYILKQYFTVSFPIFISNLSVQAYLATNKILVGFFLSLSDVAYYDLAEKILNLFKMPVSIVSQVIFPKMSNAYDKAFLKKSIGFTFSTVLVGVLIFQFVADYFVVVFAGESMLPAANLSRILILSLIPLIISNGLGIQTLLSQGYNKKYTQIVVETTLLYFVCVSILILTDRVSINSLAVISIVVEVYMLFSFYKKCKVLKLI